MGLIDQRLTELGYVLPEATSPAGSYITVVRTGNLLFTAGHISITNTGEVIKGRLGETFTVEDGYAAAHQVALSLLATLKQELNGDLDQITRIVKLTGFVNSANDFTSQADVMNGASDTFNDIFGDKSKHARSALGMNVLPLFAAVEIEAIVEVVPSGL